MQRQSTDGAVQAKDILLQATEKGFSHLVLSNLLTFALYCSKVIDCMPLQKHMPLDDTGNYYGHNYTKPLVTGPVFFTIIPGIHFSASR